MDGQYPQTQPPVEKTPQSTNTTPTSDSGTSKDSNQIAILSYLSVLVFIPYFMAENNTFVKFHVKQGLILFITEVIVSVLGMFLGFSMLGLISTILYLANLCLIILSIIGIVNVVKGEMKPLPIIGNIIK